MTLGLIVVRKPVGLTINGLEMPERYTNIYNHKLANETVIKGRERKTTKKVKKGTFRVRHRRASHRSV